MDVMPRGYNLSCLCSNPDCNKVFSARMYYANSKTCPYCGRKLYDSCIIFGFSEEQSYRLACALSSEKEKNKEETTH